jgi:hypothetical protein
MLRVYDVLCLALLGMAFFSVCFTQVLLITMVRKRFVQRARRAPLQCKITRSLQLALVVCLLAWLSAFLWGGAAVTRALMQEQIVPIFFLLFSPLFSGLVSFILFRKTLRVRIEDAKEFAKELKALHVTSDVPFMAPEAVAEGPESWSGASSPDARKKAFRAVLLLGEPSYHETLKLLQPREGPCQRSRTKGETDQAPS